MIRFARLLLPASNRAGVRPARSGFTLIELLVVLTIVGMLLALLLPLLSRAHVLAKSAICKANLRQLGLAMRSYIDDASVYPPLLERNYGEVSYWPELLRQHTSQPGADQYVAVGQSSVFACPSFRAARSAGAMVPITYGYNDVGYAFHGLGGKLVLESGGFSDKRVAEADVLVPGGTIAMGDGIARLNSGLLIEGGIRLQRWALEKPEGAAADQIRRWDKWIRGRHLGRGNILYCDGHVEANRLSFLFDDTSEVALRQWSRDHEPHGDGLRE